MDPNTSFYGLINTGHGTKESCLPRPVMTDKPKTISGLQGKVDILKCFNNDATAPVPTKAARHSLPGSLSECPGISMIKRK
jgi:hypothetical protein